MTTGSLLVGAKLAQTSVPLIRHAARIAHGDPITIVHVRVPPQGFTGCDTWSVTGLRMWQDECESEIRTAALIILDDYPGPWRVMVRHGDPARELTAQAEQERARALILGDSGNRRRFRGKPLATKIKSLTPREVVVIPDLSTVAEGPFADLWTEPSERR
ncbi:nucleotide-binding universal stress UspA family protein [Catenulispora sp. GAS73]|uniref:universal stress protein n=1 Tax=Catenulispora sp. GAS73 TaxID=3156269 RepID=UPI0035117DD5